MDQDTLAGYASGAKAASENVAQFQQDIPGLLSGLKTNLTSIFAKDNPMMAAREGALNTYLNTPSQTRANLLPSNQPIVGGSALNFSPTQQNAMVESAQNAALVPLVGLNNSIVSQYGNIGDILQAAAATYQSQLDAAKTRSTSANDLWKTAIQQAQEQRLAASDSGTGDLSAMIAALLGGQNTKPDISTFDLPETGPGGAGPLNVVQAVEQNQPWTGGSQPLVQNQPNFWDNLLGLFGATPKQNQQQATPFGQSLAGNLDFGSLPGLNRGY